jgi:hypothetical protein
MAVVGAPNCLPAVKINSDITGVRLNGGRIEMEAP